MDANRYYHAGSNILPGVMAKKKSLYTRLSSQNGVLQLDKVN